MIIPDDLRPGDVLFYKPTNLLGVIIAVLTGGWYSHVEVSLGGSLVFAAREGGVSMYPVRMDDSLCSVRRPSVPHFKEQLAWASVRDMVGQGYETGALVKFLEPWLKSKRRHVARICSSVVTAYLRGGGCKPFQPKVSASKVTPYDLWMSDSLYTVWGR